MVPLPISDCAAAGGVAGATVDRTDGAGACVELSGVLVGPLLADPSVDDVVVAVDTTTLPVDALGGVDELTGGELDVGADGEVAVGDADDSRLFGPAVRDADSAVTPVDGVGAAGSGARAVAAAWLADPIRTRAAQQSVMNASKVAASRADGTIRRVDRTLVTNFDHRLGINTVARPATGSVSGSSAAGQRPTFAGAADGARRRRRRRLSSARRRSQPEAPVALAGR